MIILIVFSGFTSLNLLKDATPIIPANVIWDADNGIAKISKGKTWFILLIKISEEKLSNMKICVNKIANAEIGFIVDIWDPTLWTIFWEKIKAPKPIRKEPKKYNLFSSILNLKLNTFKSKSKKGE